MDQSEHSIAKNGPIRGQYWSVSWFIYTVSVSVKCEYRPELVSSMGSSNGKPVLRDEDVDTIMKTSGMSEQQIRQDFEVFIKEYPTGELLPIICVLL